MLAELRQEREQIQVAILALERLAQGRGTWRRCPPALMSRINRRGRLLGSKNKPKTELPDLAENRAPESVVDSDVASGILLGEKESLDTGILIVPTAEDESAG